MPKARPRAGYGGGIAMNPELDKCRNCNGRGATEDHDSGSYSHDNNGDCLGYCPVMVQCKYCDGSGVEIVGEN